MGHRGLGALRAPAIALIVLLAAVTLMSGCAPKIVKPTPRPTPAPPPITLDRDGQMGEDNIPAVQTELKVVYFDYDSFNLSPQAQSALQYNAEVLRTRPGLKITAEGHCDERGTDEYNLALGERRSRSVTDYLAGLGVSPAVLSRVSYGAELPVDPDHNEAAWAKNRRVYVRVSR